MTTDNDIPATVTDDCDFPACPICGAELEWVDCYEIDCDDGFYHDCGEDCCCCAEPEPDTHCETCRGAGGWWECTALPHTEAQMAAYREKQEQR